VGVSLKPGGGAKRKPLFAPPPCIQVPVRSKGGFGRGLAKLAPASAPSCSGSAAAAVFEAAPVCAPKLHAAPSSATTPITARNPARIVIFICRVPANGRLPSRRHIRDCYRKRIPPSRNSAGACKQACKLPAFPAPQDRR